MVAVVLGAWRAEIHPPPAEIGRLVQDAPSAVVVTAPVFTGQRQYFAVEPAIGDGPTDSWSAGSRLRNRRPDSGRPSRGRRGAAKATWKSRLTCQWEVRAAISTRGCAASLYATSLRVIDSSPSVQRALADLRTRLDTVLRQVGAG